MSRRKLELNPAPGPSKGAGVRGQVLHSLMYAGRGLNRRVGSCNRTFTLPL